MRNGPLPGSRLMLMHARQRLQQFPELAFAFKRDGKGAVTVALEQAKRHAMLFGAEHIFLEFPLGDYVELSFVHFVSLARALLGKEDGTQFLARTAVDAFCRFPLVGVIPPIIFFSYCPLLLS